MCECGVRIKIPNSRVIREETMSCGCLCKEKAKLSKHIIHGGCLNGVLSSEYHAWRSMKSRCYKKSCSQYHNYGGRGIKVCDRWINNPKAFLEDMGKKPTPNHSLDRIDNNGDYEPSNCKWSTLQEQSNNKRTSRFITHQGVTNTLFQWSVIFKTSAGNLHRMLSKKSFDDTYNYYMAKFKK